MVDTRIFKFEPDQTYTFTLPRIMDWDSDLSVALRNQINNNHYNLRRLNRECYQGSTEVTAVVVWDGQIYLQPYHTTRSQCQNFINRVQNYLEVEKLDLDAIYQHQFNVDLHAVVILYSGNYYGHIYTWVSPINPQYCFFIGIRNRIDSIFLQGTEDELKGISKYLIDGVEQFARSQGCQKMVVVYPEPIMRIILPKMGFQPDQIPISLFGQSVQTFSTDSTIICDTCLSLDLV